MPRETPEQRRARIDRLEAQRKAEEPWRAGEETGQTNLGDILGDALMVHALKGGKSLNGKY
jgi:hypothetical protein